MMGTLRARIATAFGVGVLALVAALSFAFAAAGSAASVRDQSDALQALARSTTTLMADGLFERLREVRWLAATPPSDGVAGWAAALQKLQASRPHFSWIGVTDADGQVQVATGGLLVGRSVAERPWFRAARDGPHVGDVHAAKLLASLLPPAPDGEPLRFIDFAAPLKDAQGRLIGVLGVHATWAWAQHVIDSLKSSLARERGVRVFIFDRHGAIIHRPQGSTGAVTPVAVAALPDKGATVLTWDDGKRYLTAAWRLDTRLPEADLGWTVVTRQPLDVALAASRKARNTALVFGVVAALLASALAWVLAGHFSAPLARIADAAKAVQAGRLDTEIPLVGGARELRDLSGALHGMTQTLVQRERDLERRVEERTRELARATQALEAANAELQTLATRDALTGLLNRRAGDERLQQELARHRRGGQPLALVIADIDHFKAVNDRHGHAAGDAVLREVAACLRDGCRATDAVVRWGGEEFLLLMPETSAEGARVACEKLREAVAAHAGSVRVTLSLGVVAPVQSHGTLAAALEAADQALYAAKAGGRNQVRLAPQPPASSTMPSASSAAIAVSA